MIEAGRQEGPAVRSEADGPDEGRVVEGMQLRALGEIPEPGCTAAVAGRGEHPVGAEGNRHDRLLVDELAPQVPAGRELPQPHVQSSPPVSRRLPSGSRAIAFTDGPWRSGGPSG